MYAWGRTAAGVESLPRRQGLLFTGVNEGRTVMNDHPNRVIADLNAVRDGTAAALPEGQSLREQLESELDRMAGAVEAAAEPPVRSARRRRIPLWMKVLAATTAVLSLLVLAGVALAWTFLSHHTERRRAAAEAFDAAMEVYHDARRDYHRTGEVELALAGFRDAKARLRQWADRHGDLPDGAVRARAWERMSRAYEAMIVGDFEEADEHLEAASRLGALDREAVINPFATALNTRRAAVTDLEAMARAIGEEDFERADLIAGRLAGLRAPPDQQDRFARLTEQMAARRRAYEFRRLLAAGDAAMANAEAAIAADRNAELAEAIAHLDEARRHYRLAESRAGTPEVRRRLEAVRLAEAFVEARLAYLDTVAGDAPAAERIEALQAVVDARPPTEALQDELATARAEEAWQRAAPLLESQLTSDLETAREVLAESIGHKRRPKAVTALAQVETTLQHDKLVAEARTAMDEGRWAEAVERLQQAQTLEQRAAAESIRQASPVADLLSDARVGLHLSAGHEARLEHRWAEARAQYEKAGLVRPHDAALAAQVGQYTNQTDREEQIYAWVDEGRRHLAAKDYKRAVAVLNRAYRAAEGLDTPREAVREVRQLAHYRWEIAKGQAAEAQGHVRMALGCYRVAEQLMPTDEVRALIRGLAARRE